MRPRLLIVSHQDASGTHGLTGDIRAAEAMGAEPVAVTTGFTLGPPGQPQRFHPVPTRILDQMLGQALAREPVAAFIGLLARPRQVRAVARHIRENGPSAIVVAPLSMAFDARPLLSRRTLTALRKHLLPIATAVVLPAPQAEALMPGADQSLESMKITGQQILDAGAHLAWLRSASHEGRSLDVVVDHHGAGLLDYPPPVTDAEPHLAPSALAALLAVGIGLREGIDRAHRHAYRLDRAAHRIS